MDAHPDAVMPSTARHASSQQRIDSPPRDHERSEIQSQLRARLLQMIVANEKLRNGSAESSRPR
jgi:hypothetical protein